MKIQVPHHLRQELKHYHRNQDPRDHRNRNWRRDYPFCHRGRHHYPDRIYCYNFRGRDQLVFRSSDKDLFCQPDRNDCWAGSIDLCCSY